MNREDGNSLPMHVVDDIIRVVEQAAPLGLQEPWDNSGLQVGHRDGAVTGVLTAVDVTPEVVDEAVANGCNMIVSHHPVLFKGLKSITGDNRVQTTVEKAIRNGVAVYSAHTSLDNSPLGVSRAMARLFDGEILGPLVPQQPDSANGSGVVLELSRPVAPEELVRMAKKAFDCRTVRCSDLARRPGEVSRVALCGGAGGSFIDDALKAGAQAYITGDLRYHDFVDYADRILLIDCGHYETEQVAVRIFTEAVGNAFPGLRTVVSSSTNNPVTYM